MTTEELNEVTKRLGGATVDETGLLSFKGKGLKLDRAKDGKFQTSKTKTVKSYLSQLVPKKTRTQDSSYILTQESDILL